MQTNKPFYTTMTFWIVAAFVIGFGVNELLSAMHINPLRSQASMSAQYGGIPRDCTSFYGDTIYCWRDSFGTGQWQEIGGGGGSAAPHNPQPPAQTTPSTGGTRPRTIPMPGPSCAPVPGDFDCNGIPDNEE